MDDMPRICNTQLAKKASITFIARLKKDDKQPYYCDSLKRLTYGTISVGDICVLIMPVDVMPNHIARVLHARTKYPKCNYLATYSIDGYDMGVDNLKHMSLDTLKEYYQEDEAYQEEEAYQSRLYLLGKELR
jgi:hypothetical protein